MSKTHQEPFFVSSASHHGRDENSRRFVLQLQPPMTIPAEATSARAFVHSATVPYTFPNVVAGKNTLRIGVPLDADFDGVVEVPTTKGFNVSIAPGIYTLDKDDTSNSLERALNEAIAHAVAADRGPDYATYEAGMHLVDAQGVPNFLTLTPNFALGRVDLTLNHDHTNIQWTNAATTLEILGFPLNTDGSDSVRTPLIMAVDDLSLTLKSEAKGLKLGLNALLSSVANVTDAGRDQKFANVVPNNADGSASNVVLTIGTNSSNAIDEILATTPGSGFTAGDTLTVRGSDIGGSTDAVITLQADDIEPDRDFAVMLSDRSLATAAQLKDDLNTMFKSVGSQGPVQETTGPVDSAGIAISADNASSTQGTMAIGQAIPNGAGSSEELIDISAFGQDKCVIRFTTVTRAAYATGARALTLDITTKGSGYRAGDTMVFQASSGAANVLTALFTSGTDAQRQLFVTVLEHDPDPALGNLLDTFEVTVVPQTVVTGTEYNPPQPVGTLVHTPYGKYTYTSAASRNFVKFAFGDIGDRGDPGLFYAGLENLYGGVIADTNPPRRGYYVYRIFGSTGPSPGVTWSSTQPGSPLYTPINIHAGAGNAGSAALGNGHGINTELLQPTKNTWLANNFGQSVFRAPNPAKIDKVTEVGITVTPLVDGGTTSSGKPAAGVLARFQLKGKPGSVMAFEPGTLIKTDCSRYIGSDFSNLTFGLVDQNGEVIESLQGEDWSTIIVVEYDMPLEA